MNSGNSPIDWAAVHARLADTERALEALVEPPPERLREVQLGRARQLSARYDSAAEGEALAVLVVVVADQRCAIPLTGLAGVERLVPVSPLPGAPPVLAGVASWRGKIVPVLDLCRVVGASRDGEREAACDGAYLVVARRDDARIALLVDRLEGRRALGLDDLSEVELDQTGVSSMRAITPGGLVLLDPDSLLDHPTLQEGQ